MTTTKNSSPIVSLSSKPAIVSEGKQLFFNFDLSQEAPTEGLTVRLALLRDTDPLPGDITYFVDGSTNITNFELIRGADGLITNALVTIAPGATTATLVSNVINDSVVEPEETVVYTLAAGANYEIDSRENSASFTLTDFPVISLSSQPANVVEGNKLEFNFDLSTPTPTDGLTVRLSLLRDTDPAPGDITYFVNGSQNITDFQLIRGTDGLITDALVTLAGGVTSAKLVSDVIADGVSEGAESVTYGLAAGDSYSIDPIINNASFTIVDPSYGHDSSSAKTSTSELVSFELKDVVIPAQSGVANVSVNLDYKAGIDNSQFRNILPVAEFVKDSLTNSRNPNDYYEIINRNVTTSLLNNSSFDFTSVLDSASIKLDLAPNAGIPFAFSNTIALTPDGKTDALVSFELKDVVIPAQSGVANVSVNLDYKAGVDNTQFRNILPVAEFVKDSLTNSRNPNEYYEIINRNVTTSLLNNSSFDFTSVLDSASIKLDVAPNAGIPFAFSNTIALTPDGKTDALVSFELKDVVIPAQSGVANVSVNLDYKAGVDNTQFRDIIPVAQFVKDSLTNSRNPNEFYEVINRNVTEQTFSDLGLSSVLDSLSITLGVAPNSGIPFPFTNTVTITQDGITQLHGNHVLELTTI